MMGMGTTRKNKHKLPADAIGKTKAFKWAKELLEWDHKRFEDFNASYVGTGRETVARTHMALRNVLDRPETSKEAFFKEAFPEDKFSQKKIGQRLGHFMEALKRFIALEGFLHQLDDDPGFLKLHFLKGLNDRSRSKPLHQNATFWEEYEKDYRSLRAEYSNTHRIKLLMELESDYIQLKPHFSKKGGSFNSLTDQKILTFDHHFYLSRLRETCILLSNYALFHDAAFDPLFVSQIRKLRSLLAENPKADFLEGSQTKMYETLLDLLNCQLEDPDSLSLEEVWALSDIALADRSLLENDIIIFGLFSNILTQQITKGHEEFRIPYFKIASDLLAKEKLVDRNGRTHAPALKTIVVLGFHLGGEYEEQAEELLRKLKRKVDLVDKDRAALVDLCTGWKMYFKRQFPLAYKRARTIRFTLPDWQVQVQQLLFQSTFSNNWTSSAFAIPEMDFQEEYEALAKWTRPEKGLSSKRKANLEVKIRFFSDLVRLASEQVAQEERAEVLQKLLEDLAFAELKASDVDWIKEMSGHLK